MSKSGRHGGYEETVTGITGTRNTNVNRPITNNATTTAKNVSRFLHEGPIIRVAIMKAVTRSIILA